MTLKKLFSLCFLEFLFLLGSLTTGTISGNSFYFLLQFTGNTLAESTWSSRRYKTAAGAAPGLPGPSLTRLKLLSIAAGCIAVDMIFVTFSKVQKQGVGALNYRVKNDF